MISDRICAFVHQKRTTIFGGRIWEFIFHKQTRFWFLYCFPPFILFRYTWGLPTGFNWITFSDQTAPGIVILSSIFATTIWCYRFMLVPVLKDYDKLFKNSLTSRTLFQFLFWFTILFNLLLIHVYVSALLHTGNIDGAKVTGSEAVEHAFLACGAVVGPFLSKMHLFIYVLCFSLMDLIVGLRSSNLKKKRQFADIFVFIDIPMILALIFIIFIIRPLLYQSYYFFEAGMIAFQLIAGSFSVIGLEILEDMVSASKKKKKPSATGQPKTSGGTRPHAGS